jgi:hypothetical protein
MTALLDRVIQRIFTAGQPPEVAMRSLGDAVQQLASKVDTMWSVHPTDGSVAFRLVEASHSLHRAAIVLRDDVVSGVAPQPLSRT